MHPDLPRTINRSVPLALTRSHSLLESARQRVPGLTHSMMKRPEMFDPGSFPVFLERGRGALVSDVDGNEYIDFICGLGANTLGHQHPRLLEGITRQLQSGILHSLPTQVELQAADAIRAVVPHVEMLRFFKTGADATSASVRLARHITGRDHIVVVGYNGFHDHFMFDTPGVPRAIGQLTQRMPLFSEADEAPLLELLERRGSELALLLLSVPYNRRLSRDFLVSVQERCARQGIMFVLDEIVTGFRVALGGIQELYDVRADWVCLSKGIAGGMPLSAVAGSARQLSRMGELQVSTTFGGEALSLAACVQAISVYQDTDYVAHIARLGRRLSQGVNEHCERHDIPLRVVGYDAIPTFEFARDPQEQARLARPFVGAMARRGVLLRRDVNFLCAAHSEAQIDYTVEACRDALAEWTRLQSRQHG